MNERSQVGLQRVVVVFAVVGVALLLLLGLALAVPAVKEAVRSLFATDIAKLQHQVDDLKAQVTSLHKSLDTREADNNSLKQQLQTLTSTKGASDQLVSQLKDQTTSLQGSLASAQNMVNQLQAQVSELKDEIATRDRVIADLRGTPPSSSSSSGPVGSTSPSQGGTGSTGTVVFYDDFSRGPQAAWSPTAGNWVGSENGYTVTNTANQSYFSFVSSGHDWDNYAVDVDVENISANSTFMVIARATDESNYVGFYSLAQTSLGFDWMGGGWSCLLTQLNGSPSICPTQSRVKNTLPSTTHIRLEVIGNRAVAFINHVKFGEVTGGFPSAGMPGLFIGGAADGLVFKNFQVTLINAFSS